MMTELKPFQKVDTRRIYHFRGRALLASEMGLGKTIQALYWILKTPSARPVVFICPAAMKWTWQTEALDHFGIRTEVLDGKCKKRTKRLPGNIVIINYEILASWLPLLLAADPQTIIIDEIHYIKNIEAARTKAAFKLCEDARSVVGLSGTPILNRPIELWAVLHVIRPDLFPSREKYAWRYCKPRHTPWGWQYDGATNLPELHRILNEECMIRRLKADVLPELPPKVRQVVSFRLTSYTEYHRAEHDFLNWLSIISPARAKRAKRSQALTKIGYLLRLVAQLKLEWTEKWVRDFFEANEGEKLVALTMHTFVIDHLKKKFPGAIVIDGRVTGKKRVDSVRLFQNSPRFPLLLGNWKAAGVGITLTAASNTVGLDFPWTSGDMLQGEDRVHRIGQKKSVTIHYLAAMNTIEEKQMKVLRQKSSILDAVLDGKEPAARIDMFDALISEISR